MTHQISEALRSFESATSWGFWDNIEKWQWYLVAVAGMVHFPNFKDVAMSLN